MLLRSWKKEKKKNYCSEEGRKKKTGADTDNGTSSYPVPGYSM
jgi:hypothetical protein